MAAGWRPWQFEVVAGIIEAGESPDDVARRETREETGREVLDLLPICRYLVSPGGATESVALFCARVDSRDADGIFGLAHEGENIRVTAIPFAEASAMLADGRIQNALGIISLQWLALNRERIRGLWL